jgi:Transglycosylase SLT domain
VFRSIAAIVLAIRSIQPDVGEADANRYATALQIEAERHDFDPLTGVAIIQHESRFRARAISPDKEDFGLGQVRARHFGACKKDRDPKLRPSAGCRAVKERLLEPEENIRIMAELITSHRKICRMKAGNDRFPSWLASYQGRNSIKENRWCVPGDGTLKVIRVRDRLARVLMQRSEEIAALEQLAEDRAQLLTDARGEEVTAETATIETALVGPQGG